jgi:phage FluMu protein Com
LKAIYRCKKCRKKVVVISQKGHFKRPRCPKCHGAMGLRDKDVEGDYAVKS